MGICSTTHSLKICSSATCHGIAYSVRDRPILAWAQSAGYRNRYRCPFDPSTPVYSGYGPEGDFFAVDPKMRTPYIQNFNLNLQHQISGARCCRLDTSARSGGSCSSSSISINLVKRPHRVGPCQRGQQLRYPHDSNFFYLNQEKSAANSKYHALQTSFRTTIGTDSLRRPISSGRIHRYRKRSRRFEPNQAQPQNSTNPAGDRGNSSFDIRRRFTWNFNYEFPQSRSRQK